MPNTHTTLTSLFSDIADAIREKTGGSADIVADSFPTAISSIPTGCPLPQLTEPAAAGDILSGKEAINGQGSKLTGTLNICDSISVDEVYLPSEGVASMQVTSTKDDSAKVITWQEPDVLPENIVAGKTILGVTGTYVGGGETEVTVTSDCANAAEIAAALAPLIPGYNNIYYSAAIFKSVDNFSDAVTNQVLYVALSAKGTSYYGIWYRKTSATAGYESSSFAAAYNNTNIASGAKFKMVTIAQSRP